MTLLQTFSTVRGRKNLEAATGILLLMFCAEHLIANLFLLSPNPEPYRWYTQQMGHNIAVRIAEVLLFALFALHIGLGLVMRYKHHQLRKRAPFIQQPKSLSTRFVGWTGTMILVFLIVHLEHFFLPNRITTIGKQDLYALAHESFSNFWYVVLYIVCMGALASHLHHGVKSAVVSFKFIPPKRLPQIRKVVGVFAVITPLGLGYIALHLFIISLR